MGFAELGGMKIKIFEDLFRGMLLFFFHLGTFAFPRKPKKAEATDYKRPMVTPSKCVAAKNDSRTRRHFHRLFSR